MNEEAKQMARTKKARAIRKACAARDVEALAAHATSEGGLLDDGLRQIAWPIFLHCDNQMRQYNASVPPSTALPRHADEEQVELDVNRSFVYYPKAVKHLHLIPAIIETTDPELRRHLGNIEPFFALAATLTLYSHDIQEYSNISRLFDFLLAREPVVAIYLFASMILSRKKELLEIPPDEPEMLHFTLSKLPCPLDLDGHILHAAQLFEDHPPESLPLGAWKRIPWCSVLKTSRDPHQKYTPEDAMCLFEKQSQQIRAEERRKRALDFLWSHRRSVGSVALAILVGAASFYIRKKGLDTSVWSYVGRIRKAIQNWI
ncbi:hypothetical protein E8E15_006150 [Penicillium rubens]|nr:hypothetical protein E8E15_006150 [Penicillium rubens]